MGFRWPEALPLLAVVPVFFFLYLRLQSGRARRALRYASPAMVRTAVGSGPGRRRHVPPALFLAALALLLVALARPVAVVTVPSREGTVILLMDVSGSMRAPDLQPSRLDAAKAAASRLVDKQRGNDKARIGVVSFSDQAFVVQPPTGDRDATIAAIARLQTQRGTAIGQGILVSLDAIFEGSGDELASDTFAAQAAGQQPSPPPASPAGLAPATIILLTDGVNTRPPDPRAVLDEATSRGVRIYAVGVGSASGAILGVGPRAFNARFDEAMLRRIAETTDGEYFSASNADDLARIYDDLATQLVLRTERTELSAVFTGLGAVLLLAGAAFSLALFGRLP